MTTAALQRDAAPSKALPGRVRLFGGLSVTPLAWSVHLLICYSLAAHACFPKDLALAAPLWPHLRAIVAGVTVMAWVVAVFGCVLALANWKATRKESDASAHSVLSTGDGRTRFMALCGLMVSGVFAIALVFTSFGVLWVPECAL